MDNNDGMGGYYRTYDRFLDRYGPELDPISIAVYHYLVRCADKDGYCHPGYERIAYHCGRISRRSAEYAVAKLIKLGLIERRHRKKSNGSADTNRYKIRLEAFTDAALRGGVAHHMREGSAPYALGVAHHMRIKDNTVEGKHKKGEREGEPPLSIPPDPLPVSSNSPQEGETSKVGGNVEAVTAQSAGGDSGLSCQDQGILEAFTDKGAHREVVHEVHQVVHEGHRTAGESPEAAAKRAPCLSDPIPVAKAATKANGKFPTGGGRQHQSNGAGQPSPIPWALSDNDIRAAMQRTGWNEAKVRDEASKFKNRHLSRGTLSCNWMAEWENWIQRGLEYAAKNGKAPERVRPLPPLIHADRGPAVLIDKEAGKAAMAEIRRIMRRQPQEQGK
jgi:hypothetical protein